jgi:hypothetical protein
VAGVRSAIHVRTGPSARVEALDAWLARHQVEVTPFDDVYAACVHLLKHYEHIPDLVFVGADWLSRDELSIVSYVRQTWSRSGIIVYSDHPETPLFDFLPFVLTCRGDAAIRELLAATPADLVRRLGEQLRPLVLAPPPPGAVAARSAEPLRPRSSLVEQPGDE